VGDIGVFVGGVGQLYQGDLDVGRVVVERLGDLGQGVVAEELHYGAVAVAQRLEELAPHTLIIVGAEPRGRPPATVERRWIERSVLTPEDVHGAVSDAVQGYVAIDLVLDVATGLDALPPRVVAIEVEPVRTESDPTLSPEVEAGLEEMLELVRIEIVRAPMMALAAEIRAELADGHLEDRFAELAEEPSEDRLAGLAEEPSERSASLDALYSLLAELATVDRTGRWGRTFAERDRLRYAIAEGDSAEGMRHLDWGLWWTLIEELDRLQGSEIPAEP
jgi:hypothetical protein